jgi:hypothetical protein
MLSLATIKSIPFLANPIVWAGAAAATLAVGVPVLLKWLVGPAPTRRCPPRPEAGPLPQPPAELADNWELPPQQEGDCRRHVRRPGNAVPVFIKSACGFEQQGYVLDRSKCGIRLSTAKSIAAGTTIQVRTPDAPAGIPWVEARVHWCSKVDGGYEAGCHLVHDLPWNVLLLFG